MYLNCKCVFYVVISDNYYSLKIQEDFSSSFVYCTHDNIKWHFLGYFGHVKRKACLAEGIALINPFYGTAREENIQVLHNPPISVQSNPACDGARSLYGNCIPKKKVCDGIETMRKMSTFYILF